MNKDITIVLISHKSRELILTFITSLYNKFKIIIIDNSNDRELEKNIKLNYPNITIRLIKNNGYGSAINFANKFITTDYFIISNPDIIGLDEENILEFLSASNELDGQFSCLGPRYIDADKKSHIQSDLKIEIAEMKFISGACMFFKKKTYDSLGGFDENFFLYFEESDFCLRAHKIKKNYQINGIKVKHYTGTSVQEMNIEKKRALQELYNWHFIWSKFYYYKKNYGYFYSLIYFFPIIVRTIFKIIFNIISENKFEEKKYRIRLDGLVSSIMGKKSYKRID
jgi:N-acetylglucosaminyl-diphospho-decaprenol L-rhamnosyltransferase